MIILDRLYDTLDCKIVDWGMTANKSRGTLGIFNKDVRQLDDILVERLVALYDIARAMKYLHQNR